MNHLTRAIIGVSLLSVFACGRGALVPAPIQPAPVAQTPAPQGSGLPPSSDLTSLSPAEQQALCEWQISTLGGPERSQWCAEPCMNGACAEAIKTEPWSLTVCLGRFAAASSGCTVAVFEQCATELSADLCKVPQSCDPLLQCL